VDHWAGCAHNEMYRLVVESMIWPQPASVQPGLAWLEVLLRSIGNYKCMTGFMMVSAHMDSAYEDAAQFSKGDLAVFLTYLQFMWVLDPIVWAMCSRTHPELCTDTSSYFVGVHRWYLLVMLLIKVVLVFFRLLRLPPLAQCAAITLLGFAMPAEVGCLSAAKCEWMPDPAFWKANYKSLDALWYFLLRGPLEDSHGMFTSALMRYYILFMAQYFWTFHYGRWVAQQMRVFFQWASQSWSSASVHVRWKLARLVAFLAFMFCELIFTGLIGPRLYNFLQEDFTGTREPQLLPLLLILVSLMLQVMLLAFALSTLRGRLKLLGSTTLGCYMIHMYFTYPLMAMRPSFAFLASYGIAGLLAQMLLLLGIPLLFQLTIGAAFHKLLLLQHKAIFHALSSAQSRSASLVQQFRGSCACNQMTFQSGKQVG